MSKLKVGLMLSEEDMLQNSFKLMAQRMGLKKNSNDIYSTDAHDGSFDYIVCIHGKVSSKENGNNFIESNIGSGEIFKGMEPPLVLILTPGFHEAKECFNRIVEDETKVWKTFLRNIMRRKDDSVYYLISKSVQHRSYILSVESTKRNLSGFLSLIDGFDEEKGNNSGLVIASGTKNSLKHTDVAFGMNQSMIELVMEGNPENNLIINPLYNGCRTTKVYNDSDLESLITFLSEEEGFRCLEDAVLNGYVDLIGRRIKLDCDYGFGNQEINLTLYESVETKENTPIRSYEVKGMFSYKDSSLGVLDCNINGINNSHNQVACWLTIENPYNEDDGYERTMMAYYFKEEGSLNDYFYNLIKELFSTIIPFEGIKVEIK